MIKKYESIVNNDIKHRIKNSDWVDDIVHYGLFKNQLDGTLAAAAFFCPDIICIKDYVFLGMFFGGACDEKELINTIEKLEVRYSYCKKDIEMAINSWSLRDFFLEENDLLSSSDEVIHLLGETLCYFWQIRVNSLFPDKKIVVELGNDLMGEEGLCITMYEDD